MGKRGLKNWEKGRLWGRMVIRGLWGRTAIPWCPPSRKLGNVAAN